MITIQRTRWLIQHTQARLATQRMRASKIVIAAFTLGATCALGGQTNTIFLEAESFNVPVGGGWSAQPATVSGTGSISGGQVLSGSSGSVTATASRVVSIPEEGSYTIWVRHLSSPDQRGPFRLSVRAKGQDVADAVFDHSATGGVFSSLGVRDKVVRGRLESFQVHLPRGEVELLLTKEDQQNCAPKARKIDYLVLTDDPALVPDHLDFVPQTWLRITLGDVYDRPVQIHAFAIFSGHFHFSQGGIGTGTGPKSSLYLTNGMATPWCNITRMLHPGLKLGARPQFTAMWQYGAVMPRLQATFEFATAPAETSVVKRLDIDYEPGTLFLVLPTDLASPENLSRFIVDRELAEQTGQQADNMEWPTVGHLPTRFPFSTSIHNWESTMDREIYERERKTLAYFGFTNFKLDSIYAGLMNAVKNQSTFEPDLALMESRSAAKAASFLASGRSVSNIVFCKLMDEPNAVHLAKLVQDTAGIRAFRDFMQAEGLTPAGLGVADWSQVRPVGNEEREQYPALYYYSQRFRTQNLGHFMAVQTRAVAKAYGREIPCFGNFSDVAVFSGNMYSGAADYFLLMENPGVNALWSECGANLAVSAQCANYNMDLQRGAVRDRPEAQLGHYLINYGRPAWEVKCKAVGHVARGARVLVDYAYGPTWHSYEGGPPWRTSAWYARPEKWYSIAELSRELGAVEDWLLSARTLPAKVAILYSSSSDIWTTGPGDAWDNAFGFDRMFTWLALTHAQIPVDILSEQHVADGALDDYRVCYFSGPNLRQAAAQQLEQWVSKGGVLHLSAAAGERDEFNRPMKLLDSLLPATRSPNQVLNRFKYYSSGLWGVKPQGHVRASGDPSGTADVLCHRQNLTPHPGAEVLAHFDDDTAAIVRGTYGRGAVYCAGFLPGLSYARPATMSRRAIETTQRKIEKSVAGANDAETEEAAAAAMDQIKGEVTLASRSRGAWEFPSAPRTMLLTPVDPAVVAPPIRCNTPLVDAVAMSCPQGLLVSLANWTLTPVTNLVLNVRVPGVVTGVESVHCGALPFQISEGCISVTLPLESTDFIKIHF